MNFTQFVNRNVAILGRRLYSQSLQDLAWLEDARLIFLNFHTFVCKMGWVDAVREKKNRKMYKKLNKLTERLLAQLRPEYNLLPFQVKLRLKSCARSILKKLFTIRLPCKHCYFCLQLGEIENFCEDCKF